MSVLQTLEDPGAGTPGAGTTGQSSPQVKMGELAPSRRVPWRERTPASERWSGRSTWKSRPTQLVTNMVTPCSGDSFALFWPRTVVYLIGLGIWNHMEPYGKCWTETIAHYYAILHQGGLSFFKYISSQYPYRSIPVSQLSIRH